MTVDRRLSMEEKKEIFSQLVATQDATQGSIDYVRKSYELVSGQFSISEEQLKAIEIEGSDNDWPPLGEPAAAL